MSKDIEVEEKEKKNRLKLKTRYKVLIFFIIVLIGCLAFRYVQKYMFFYPWNDTLSHRQLKKYTDFVEVNIMNEGRKLNGWMFYNNPKNVKSPLVIYFGGNAENSSNTMSFFFTQDMFRFYKGYNVLMVDYPGYGYSEGDTGEESMFSAADDIYDWATRQSDVDANNIVVLGYSIGTGVATYCASEKNVNGLILVAPYDEAMSLYNGAINSFYGPMRSLAKYRFNSLLYAKTVETEVQVITSYDDEVIDYKLSQKLSDAFEHHKEILILDNDVSHGEYFTQYKVMNTIYEFLQERLNVDKKDTVDKNLDVENKIVEE